MTKNQMLDINQITNEIYTHIQDGDGQAAAATVTDLNNTAHEMSVMIYILIRHLQLHAVDVTLPLALVRMLVTDLDRDMSYFVEMSHDNELEDGHVSLVYRARQQVRELTDALDLDLAKAEGIAHTFAHDTFNAPDGLADFLGIAPSPNPDEIKQRHASAMSIFLKHVFTYWREQR